VTAVWPTVALTREWLWIMGVMVGAASGVLVQGLVHGLLVWTRARHAGRTVTAGPE